MALGRQAVALDRVGDDDGGPGVVDLRVGGAQRVEVVAAEVADGAEQRGVVEAGDQRGDRGAVVPAPGSARRAARRACSAAAAGIRGWACAKIRCAAPRRPAG